LSLNRRGQIADKSPKTPLFALYVTNSITILLQVTGDYLYIWGSRSRWFKSSRPDKETKR
jgi:hypothetical protein